MSTRYVETLGDIRPEWMIDLLADGTPERQFKLLFWDGKKSQVEHTLALTWPGGSEQRMFRPGKVDSTITRAIHFPTQVASYGTTRELFESLFGVIKQFSGLAETEVRLLSYAVLASGVVEFTEVPVCIALVGPPSPERRRLLRLLHCLFRRSLLLGEASLAGVSSLPMEIGPTLLIERCEPTPQFVKFLEATSSRDAQIVSKGRILNASCAKVLCSEESLSGMVPNWLGLDIPVPHLAAPLPLFDFRAQEQIVGEFQPKLEMFRLTKYALVRDSGFDLRETTNATREMVRCLGASVADDVALQAQLAALLSEQYHPIHTQAEKELHSAVIEALLALSHQANKESAGVAEITTAVNEILERRGELLEMKPRAVGSILGVLGLSTKRLGASGRGVTLLNSVRRRIHELAEKHKINGEATAAKGCAHCYEMYRKEADDRQDEVADLSQKWDRMTDKERENPLKNDL